MGGARLDLGCRRPVADHEVVEHLAEEEGTEVGEPSGERAPRLVVGDRRLVGSDHGPGVHALVDEHQAHPGDVVTGEDRPLHGRRAPPPGQQGEMHVDEPDPGGSEHVPVEDPPVGNDHGDVELPSPQGIPQLLRGFRLGDLETPFPRRCLHRRLRHPPVAAAGSVGPGDHHVDGCRLEQRGQARYRGGRCTEERRPHPSATRSPSASSLSSRSACFLTLRGSLSSSSIPSRWSISC